MVKRRKEEEIAGVLEFEGLGKDAPELAAWMAEHKERNGGKLRVAQGVKGARVIFSSAADMTRWKARWERIVSRNRIAAA
jgi:hypothetical protein